ncbi:sodium-independent anion transporter [bacterium]|nr:sodium-independent anion transporter [bacterium]
MRDVTMIDITGLFFLEDIIKSSNSNGTKVIVSNATKAVKDTLIKLEFIKRIGNENYYESIDNDILEITKN